MRRLSPVVIARGAGLVALVVVLAACSHTAAAPPTTSRATVPASSSTSTTAPASSTTSTQPASPPTCTSGELSVVNLGANGAAGSIFTSIGIINRSAAVCSLKGRPAIVLVGSLPGTSPGALQATVTHNGQGPVFRIAPERVVMMPGSVSAAGFLIQSSDVPVNGETTCPRVVSLKVTLPRITHVYQLPASFSACGGPTVAVSAIVHASALPSTGTGSGGAGTGAGSGAANPPSGPGH
jgi:hypothetical protein